MILDSRAITGLGGVLVVPPLNGSLELVRVVWTILDLGNEKHGDTDTDAIHLEAAVRHLRRQGVDPETGQLHRAHAAARLLLALLDLTRREEP